MYILAPWHFIPFISLHLLSRYRVWRIKSIRWMNKVASLGIRKKKVGWGEQRRLNYNKYFSSLKGGFFFVCGALVNKGVLLGGIIGRHDFVWRSYFFQGAISWVGWGDWGKRGVFPFSPPFSFFLIIWSLNKDFFSRKSFLEIKLIFWGPQTWKISLKRINQDFKENKSCLKSNT